MIGVMPGSPTAALVRELVRAALPHADEPAVSPVDEGGEHSTWWVGGQYVLRLTLERDSAVRQGREIALRDVVRERVFAGVPVSVAHGSWAPGLTYTVDTRLPGASAEAAVLAPEGEADLARVLSGLRGLPPGVVAGLGLPRQEPRDLGPLREDAARAARRLTADGAVPDGLVERLGSGPRPSPPGRSSCTTTSRASICW
ncbi:phosphotransferase [Streptomyces sp. G45]|uniref:phosphotransferase n=1 Tax=Streptomyces sp. G45 TaxID=3406627 RepID=UPI003C18AE89